MDDHLHGMDANTPGADLPRFDARLRQAMQAAEVPVGLADRLLAGLQAAAVANPTVDVVPSTVEPATTEPVRTEPATHVRRSRRMMIGYTAAAASLLLLATAGWYLRPQQVSVLEVPQLADLWFEGLSGQWQAAQTAPAELPLPQAIGARVQGWQSLRDAAGHRGVAYELSAPGIRRAVLFAVKAPGARTSTLPPRRPQPITGDRSVASWQSGNVLYVLVLQGDASGYQRLFRTLPGNAA